MGCGMSLEQAQHRHAGQSAYPKQPHLLMQQNQHNQQQQQPPPYQQPPQQQQHHPPQEDVTDIQVKPVQVDKAILERYVNLEREINQYEKRNVQKSLSVKEDELKDFTEHIHKLDAAFKDFALKAEKEKNDVVQMVEHTVKSFFASQKEYDAKLSKEQEEYLDALNKQEIAKKELDGAVKKKDDTTLEVENLRAEMTKLDDLYTEQDELLAGIFNGTYGSDLEDKIETELDGLLDRKQRISVAKYKWQNSRVLLQYACNQLAFACKRWQEVIRVPPMHVQNRYTMATETRNNLAAAHQNIVSAQKYLHTIEFPYCKPDELLTLSKATNNIYTDMQNNERHAHAYQCYTVTHKRAAALLQWFDLVITNTINKDMEKAVMMVAHKEKLLRKERLRLIKEKITDQGGEISENDYEEAQNQDFSDANEPELAAIAVSSAVEADKVSEAGDLPGETEDKPSDNQLAEPAQDPVQEPGAPTPLPLSELAPLPNQDAMFGDIDELKKQHEKETEEFKKAQELNKARMEQGLQEKLRARRSHRRRQQVQDQQTQQLQ